MTAPTRGSIGEEANEKPARSVSFSEENETRTFEDDHEVDIEKMWYNGDDYARMKATSREDARRWRRQGYGVLLKNVFDPTFAEAQEYLNAFTQMEGSLVRRGVERFLSRQHAEERSDRKDCARQAVLIHQGKLRRKGAKPDEFMERIAAVYKDQSRPAHIFARRLGMADEFVVVNGEDSSPASEITGISSENEGRRRERMQRRNSNMSTMSTNSMDSRRQWGPAAAAVKVKNCPGSPVTPTEEYYAAIA